MRSSWVVFVLISVFTFNPLNRAYADENTEKIFSAIYESGGWGRDEEGHGSSGMGSTTYAGVYVKFLQDFINTNDIKSIVDVGCGDWSFSKNIAWGRATYLGIDPVATLIDRNKSLYTTHTISFVQGDATEMDLPKADLLICKDVLQHLTNADVERLIKQTYKFKHCLITNDVDSHNLTSTNPDIRKGDYRTIDLTQPPFNIQGAKLLTFRAGYVTKQVLYFSHPFDDPAIIQAVTKEKAPNKTVLIAILARNKAHVLPKYLSYIENQDYDKKLITIYINTNNNEDQTEEILEKWMAKNKDKYRQIIFENNDIATDLDRTLPHGWTVERVKHLARIRNKSFQKAIQTQSDFYFVADCDNFIIPSTLKDLIQKNKPIVAPLLRAVPEPGDMYSNYFCALDPDGYYAHDPEYIKIWNREIIGLVKVPLVHCTYLIKTEFLDKLNYEDGTDTHEFVVLARTARNNHVDQYICNEKEYGTILHFFTDMTLEEEKRKVDEMKYWP